MNDLPRFQCEDTPVAVWEWIAIVVIIILYAPVLFVDWLRERKTK